MRELWNEYWQELVATVLVIVTFGVATRAYAAAKNWREILGRLAASKQDRKHKRLTRILLRAVARAPRITAHTLPMLFSQYILAFTLIFVVLGTYHAGTTVGSSFEAVRKQESLLRKTPSDNVSAVAETAPDSLGSNAQELLLEVRQLRTKAILVLCYFAVVSALIIRVGFKPLFQFLPDEITAFAFATWLEQYGDRLIAIATKDEARELSVLELRATNERGLREYLARIKALSDKYEFNLSPPTLLRWLETSVSRELDNAT